MACTSVADMYDQEVDVDGERHYCVGAILEDRSECGFYHGYCDIARNDVRGFFGNDDGARTSLVVGEFKHEFANEKPWFKQGRGNLGPELWGALFGRFSRVGFALAKNGLVVMWREGGEVFQFPSDRAFFPLNTESSSKCLFRLCQLFLKCQDPHRSCDPDSAVQPIPHSTPPTEEKHLQKDQQREREKSAGDGDVPQTTQRPLNMDIDDEMINCQADAVACDDLGNKENRPRLHNCNGDISSICCSQRLTSINLKRAVVHDTDSRNIGNSRIEEWLLGQQFPTAESKVVDTRHGSEQACDVADDQNHVVNDKP